MCNQKKIFNEIYFGENKHNIENEFMRSFIHILQNNNKILGFSLKMALRRKLTTIIIITIKGFLQR